MRVAIDFEGEGLLDGTDDREARLELLRTLESEGFTLDQLREAAAHDRLALLPVERVLAGEGKLYTQEEVAEETGLSVDFLDEGARALGVPVRDPGERAVTEEELELSRSAKALLDGRPVGGGVPRAHLRDEPLDGERRGLAGLHLRRGADPPGRHRARPRPPLRRDASRNLGPLAAPTLQQMLNLRLREQMRNTVISQAELQSGRLAGSQPITVGFVDIVGFTQLGEDVPPEDVGNVIRRFERAVAEAVEPPVRLVKTIGDAAMLVAPEPGPVVNAVVGLVERSHEESPLLRGGIASGEGLPRAGDWYGRPVNMASRLTGFARRGSVVTSKEVRDAVGDGYNWSAAGSRRFKGVKGTVDVFRVRTADGDGSSGGG